MIVHGIRRIDDETLNVGGDVFAKMAGSLFRSVEDVVEAQTAEGRLVQAELGARLDVQLERRPLVYLAHRQRSKNSHSVVDKTFQCTICKDNTKMFASEVRRNPTFDFYSANKQDSGIQNLATYPIRCLCL